MLKNLDSEADQLRFYYNYIKSLVNYLNSFYCKNYVECYKVKSIFLYRKQPLN